MQVAGRSKKENWIKKVVHTTVSFFKESLRKGTSFYSYSSEKRGPPSKPAVTGLTEEVTPQRIPVPEPPHIPIFSHVTEQTFDGEAKTFQQCGSWNTLLLCRKEVVNIKSYSVVDTESKAVLPSITTRRYVYLIHPTLQEGWSCEKQVVSLLGISCSSLTRHEISIRRSAVHSRGPDQCLYCYLHFSHPTNSSRMASNSSLPNGATSLSVPAPSILLSTMRWSTNSFNNVLKLTSLEHTNSSTAL